METPTYPVFYVTSKGALKGPRGLLHPGDEYPIGYKTDKQLETLFNNGQICVDPADAFKVQDAVEQAPLPMNEAGTDEETAPPAKVGQNPISPARAALRAAQAADKEATEVLGAGPVRRNNDEILPVTETDPSNITLADMAGQNLTVEQARALKN